MGEVITLKSEPVTGNGAREALQGLLLRQAWTVESIDFLLMELWARGYKVVPLESES